MCICGPPPFSRFPHDQMILFLLDSASAPKIPAHTPGMLRRATRTIAGAVPLSCQLLPLGEMEWISAWALSSYWTHMAWHARRQTPRSCHL